MNSTATQIAKLINTPNPSAPVTTHALSELGNGNMQNGLKRIVRYYAAESASNLKLGRIQGATTGALATVIIGSTIAFIYHSVQKKKLNEEGKIILESFQKASDESISGNTTAEPILDSSTEEQ